MGSSPAWLLIILLLNVAVSFANAASCGRAWEESKALGGWLRAVVWCAAVNSAIGFSSVVMFPLTLIAQVMFPDVLKAEDVKVIFSLWYLTIVFPMLGTGLTIMIESWNAAYRDRSIGNLSRAVYNTFAQGHNTMSAVNGFHPALESVGKMFSGKGDARGKLVLLAFVVVTLSLCAGIILTATIIHRYAGTMPLPPHVEVSDAALRS